jgi:nitroreductase
MDFFDVTRLRRSVRAFNGRPVEEPKLRQVLEAANAAPSGGNCQAYEIYVVRDVRRRSALSRAANAQGFVLAAPVSLVFCVNPELANPDYGERGRGLYPLQDATIACAYAQLAATALGLSSCWTGSFDTDAVRKVIGAEPPLEPVAILPLGYASETSDFPGRRDLDSLVHETGS